ncbi:uncharacterized protein EV422DRAFT_613751 [Fimicolochytrium jonesii]|uniref:uncharacterized protein n=1 Tax=Fimicolochytrium jonesii TaxID=1396493 RepID=UPI0022FDF47B|nr:uncharacterized protein EV422DRAFT_613751 [Fimicolochytrium jonesii]KAI8822525.1 hypothetical protein EV422DRAFT_613751 [Fimicolochytrium jonesii]
MSQRRSKWAAFVICVCLVAKATAFYLPGVAPHDYKKDDIVPLFVNALSSAATVIPYDYYEEEFNFCRPTDIHGKSESLGSILFGDRLKSSPFELKMLRDEEKCVTLCHATYKPEHAQFVNDRIRENYFIHWEVDGLPAATLFSEADDSSSEGPFYKIGFELGHVENNLELLNNHYDIKIKYHTVDKVNYRVVGVEVQPNSVKSCNNDKLPVSGDPVTLKDSEITEVDFTYTVKWEESTTPWATRWDNYLHGYDPKIHWFSLVNSAVIVLFLTGMVAIILLRALHKDIARYNAVEAQEDAQEDFGWKLVHGDVFRAPRYAMLLAVLIGSGAQLFLMVSVTLAFAVLGFLSPSSRGSLSTVMLVFYVLFGSIAGYTSARYYKMFNGEKWKRSVALTALLVPGTVFGIFLILNFFLIGAKSSGAVPFGTLFALMSMWFLISVPLCFLGAYFGFKKPKLEHPVRTNQIPRQIPEQPFYLRPLPSILMGGVLPFGAIFIELYFILASLWNDKVYYVFGFLFLVFVILVLTCSQVTVLMCYFHLCSEDYRWWWRAFLTSGASALYVFLYGLLYYYTRLTIADVPSTILYFGYTSIMSILFFLLTGTIGFTACFKFVRKIYGSIKID